MILQTGGSALGWISTRSRPSSWAFCNASSRDNTPTISPSDPITRTRGTRISLLLRFCLSWVLILRLRKWGGWALGAPAGSVGTDFYRIRAAIQLSGRGFRRQARGEVADRHAAQVLARTGPDRHGP